mgnify:CR=1 FL=1
MSIFSILDSPALGGAEQYLLSNLEFLAEKKIKITLATHNQEIKNKYQDKFEIIDLPYRLDLIGNKRGVIKFFLQAPLALFWITKILRKMKRKSQQVVAYTPGFTERLLFSPIIKLLKIKLIWLEFGPVQAVFKRNLGLPELLYKLVQSFPDQVITISKTSRQSLASYTSIDESKITVAYPGVKKITATQLKTLQKKGVSWRKNKQLTSKKLITFVGRLAQEKEVDLLIKAFSKLKLKNIKLVIIGTGPAKEIYQRLVKKLKIEANVLFTGYVSDQEKNMILATSNIFVFPSAWPMEGFGITTIEAMMMALPVITARSGPQREIVANYQTGLFFQPKNATSLVAKINFLLTHHYLAKQIGQQARAKAIQQFDQKLMHQQTLELIQSICV